MAETVPKADDIARRRKENFEERARSAREEAAEVRPEPGFGNIELSFDTMKDLLGMPLTMQVVGATVDPITRAIFLTVMSPDLPRVEEGDPIPDVQVLSRIRTIRVDPAFVVTNKKIG